MQFLRGHFQHGSQAIRAPWTIAEEHFVDRCTRCNDCITACPTKILERGSGGFPQVNFSKGECEFCGDCVTSCKESAFVPDWENNAPWNIKATIDDSCIAYKGVVCRTCEEMCDERAIKFHPKVGGVSTPEINLEHCNGCGACVEPCPINSVKMT